MNIVEVIPAEIIENVLNWLPYLDLLVVASVCKSWTFLSNKLQHTTPYQSEKYYLKFNKEYARVDDENPLWEAVFESRILTKRTQQFKILDITDLEIKPNPNRKIGFPSFLVNVALWGTGKYYYEYKLVYLPPDPADGIVQMGWATPRIAPLSPVGHGIGDCEHSYALDASRKVIWHGDQQLPYGRKFKSGDIIGCGLDLEAREITYYCNGESLGAAFKDLDKKIEYWYAGCSPSKTVHFQVLVHRSQIKYLPEKYSPLLEDYQKAFLWEICKESSEKSDLHTRSWQEARTAINSILRKSRKLLETLEDANVSTEDKITVATSNLTEIPPNLAAAEKITFAIDAQHGEMMNLQWHVVCLLMDELKTEHTKECCNKWSELGRGYHTFPDHPHPLVFTKVRKNRKCSSCDTPFDRKPLALTNNNSTPEDGEDYDEYTREKHWSCKSCTAVLCQVCAVKMGASELEKLRRGTMIEKAIMMYSCMFSASLNVPNTSPFFIALRLLIPNFEQVIEQCYEALDDVVKSRQSGERVLMNVKVLKQALKDLTEIDLAAPLPDLPPNRAQPGVPITFHSSQVLPKAIIGVREDMPPHLSPTPVPHDVRLAFIILQLVGFFEIPRDDDLLGDLEALRQKYVKKLQVLLSDITAERKKRMQHIPDMELQRDLDVAKRAFASAEKAEEDARQEEAEKLRKEEEEAKSEAEKEKSETGNVTMTEGDAEKKEKSETGNVTMTEGDVEKKEKSETGNVQMTEGDAEKKKSETGNVTMTEGDTEMNLEFEAGKGAELQAGKLHSEQISEKEVGNQEISQAQIEDQTADRNQASTQAEPVVPIQDSNTTKTSTAKEKAEKAVDPPSRLLLSRLIIRYLNITIDFYTYTDDVSLFRSMVHLIKSELSSRKKEKEKQKEGGFWGFVGRATNTTTTTTKTTMTSTTTTATTTKTSVSEKEPQTAATPERSTSTNVSMFGLFGLVGLAVAVGVALFALSRRK